MGAYMTEIWILSLFFKFFVGAAAPTKFTVAPPQQPNVSFVKEDRRNSTGISDWKTAGHESEIG
jgi:hypothetical protein